MAEQRCPRQHLQPSVKHPYPEASSPGNRSQFTLEWRLSSGIGAMPATTFHRETRTNESFPTARINDAVRAEEGFENKKKSPRSFRESGRFRPSPQL